MVAKITHIIEQENILNKEECDWIINAFSNSIKESTVGSREIRKLHTSRTSYGTKVPIILIPEWFYFKILTKISLLTNYPIENQESWELIRYRVGEEYKPHFDLLQEPSDCGPRIYSALIFLREPEKGGEILFSHINQKIKPRLGKLVIWNNCDENGARLVTSMHGASPVISGEKWSFITWIHDRKYF